VVFYFSAVGLNYTIECILRFVRFLKSIKDPLAMIDNVINLGIVGVGKIVRDQHLPSIAKNKDFKLSATASRNASLEGIDSFIDIASMLDSSNVDAVALCMPPQFRYSAAKLALERGKHVLLEKPPGATVSEVEQLVEVANRNGVSLYATWHSRHGAAVAMTKALLKQRTLRSASIVWKEDVRKWHPGQEWIWQAGGLGVFDPGINALSILTDCLASSADVTLFPATGIPTTSAAAAYITPAYVTKACLKFPLNKAAPIAAEMSLLSTDGVDISAQLDWRVSGDESWNIDFQTDGGLLQLKDGGASLIVDGAKLALPEHSEHVEYEAIYQRFAQIIQNSVSDVDLSPLKLVADAFLLASREEVAAFE
jgi:D-galactose 1-dehydrogenase